MPKESASILKKGMRQRKPRGFTLGLAGFLAALMVCAGGGPMPWPIHQAASAPLPVRFRAAPVQPGCPAPIDLKEVQELIWRFTNDTRRQHGLPPVSPDASLSRICLIYSVDMLNRNFFSHINPEGLTAGDRLTAFYQGPISGWGENIWEGSDLCAVSPVALARHIMDAWLYSPGHRQNILNPEYTHMGIGIAANGRQIRATQLFATPQ